MPKGHRRSPPDFGDIGVPGKKKAKIARQEVIYLGYKIKQGQRWLTQAMKETILRIPEPTTPRQVREFLGMVGYCRLWIMGFAEKA